MSERIRLLPENVANQIAAGEVVQRPASVVKELLENAVDAGATEIQLIVKDAGRSLIQVVDNGCGMSAKDAMMAFERHATSKISSAHDLFALTTNGFRGEALASIAAVAHVRLKTRRQEDELATEIMMHGGEMLKHTQVSANAGSSLEVKNLFYNIPARRNFLKSNAVETRHITEAFQRVAFTYPHIQFKFVHNDSEIFNLPASNRESISAALRQRIIGIMGKSTNEKLVPIEEETDILKIHGFVAKPVYAKKKRGEQFFFVNNRFIKHNYLHHAVGNAFEGLINQGHHPSYYLYLEVPPQSIDVNIHPTKTEVKFDNERDLYAIIRSTIKHSLGQYNVSPTLDFDRDANLDVPYVYKDKPLGESPGIEVDKNFNPFQAEYSRAGMSSRKKEAAWETLYVANDPEPAAHDSEKELIHNIEVEADNVSEQLFEERSSNTHNTTFQIHLRYVASSITSGMVLLEQNYAHQRILYEEYLEKLTQDGMGQQRLLFPLQMELSKNDIAVLQGIEGDLNSAGFHIKEFKEDCIVIDSIPANIRESMIPEVIESLIEGIQNELPGSSFSQLDLIAKNLARSLAIKSGTRLLVKEQEDLLNRLFSCKEPNYSPFGKKTFITLSFEDLEERFNL